LSYPDAVNFTLDSNALKFPEEFPFGKESMVIVVSLLERDCLAFRVANILFTYLGEIITVSANPSNSVKDGLTSVQ